MHEGSSDWVWRLARRAPQYVADNYLPLALCSALLVGYHFPQSGLAAADLHLQHAATLAIFVLSGMCLRRGEAATALKSPGSLLYGWLSILVLTPLAALLAVRLPLQPPEFALGLAIFCCMPTALSAGVSLTQAVGGNTAIALLLTVSTNFLAVFTLPFTVTHLLGASAAARPMSPWPLLSQLLHSVLLPTLLGISMRALIPGLAEFVDARKRWVGYISSTLLALAPWMQVSRAAAQKLSVTSSQLLTLAGCAVVLHVLLLACNLCMVNTLQLGGRLPASGRTKHGSSSEGATSLGSDRVANDNGVSDAPLLLLRHQKDDSNAATLGAGPCTGGKLGGSSTAYGTSGENGRADVALAVTSGSSSGTSSGSAAVKGSSSSCLGGGGIGGPGPPSAAQVVGVRRAVALVASQKTLVVAVAVLGGVGGAAGGLAVVPCVLAHLGQVVVDSLVVSHWQKRDRLRAHHPQVVTGHK